MPVRWESTVSHVVQRALPRWAFGAQSQGCPRPRAFWGRVSSKKELQKRPVANDVAPPRFGPTAPANGGRPQRNVLATSATSASRQAALPASSRIEMAGGPRHPPPKHGRPYPPPSSERSRPGRWPPEFSRQTAVSTYKRPAGSRRMTATSAERLSAARPQRPKSRRRFLPEPTPKRRTTDHRIGEGKNDAEGGPLHAGPSPRLTWLAQSKKKIEQSPGPRVRAPLFTLTKVLLPARIEGLRASCLEPENTLLD